MTKFNQSKFESEAKKLVAEYLNYKVNEKELSIVGFCKVGANTKAMLRIGPDYRYFDVTYFGKEGVYILDVYHLVGRKEIYEEEL